MQVQIILKQPKNSEVMKKPTDASFSKVFVKLIYRCYHKLSVCEEKNFSGKQTHYGPNTQSLRN